VQTSDPKVNLLIRLTIIYLNISVCHHQKGGDCWNKMCLTLPPLSFDDNKVLKCQLDMLIFIQVYRTIVKNYKSIIGSIRTNESN